MSFVITMYVREGIVMASDSRLTLNTESTQNDKTIVQVSVAHSDSTYKTFLTPNQIGISSYGKADIEGIPISGYVESFIYEKASDEETRVEDVAQKLLEYFRKFKSPPETHFHVAGYKKEKKEIRPQVWQVDVSRNNKKLSNISEELGALWGGEADILSRLIKSAGILDDKGKVVEKLPYYHILFQYFTLQDAIDFCIFAVRSTIDAIKFQPRPKTVGGPIDVLVIKPDQAFWVQRKELHG